MFTNGEMWTFRFRDPFTTFFSRTISRCNIAGFPIPVDNLPHFPR